MYNLKKISTILLFIFISCLAISQNINPNGFNELYYANGVKSSEGNMKDGKPDGYWKTYYETGKIKSEGNRKDYKLDSLWRTEFGNIAIETYSLHEVELSQKFIFKNYSIEEVKRIIRILFVNDEYHKWDGNIYGPKESGAGCFVEIKEETDKIVVTFGCSC